MRNIVHSPGVHGWEFRNLSANIAFLPGCCCHTPSDARHETAHGGKSAVAPIHDLCRFVFSGPVPLESNRCTLQWLGNRLPLQQRPRLPSRVLPKEQHTGRMGTGRLLVLTTRYGPHLVYTCILGLHLGHTLSTIFNDYLAEEHLIETRQSNRSPSYIKKRILPKPAECVFLST